MSLGRTTVLKHSQFDLLQQIGTGSFGTVFKAFHKPSKRECAIKRIDLESTDDDIEEIQKEIAILAECNNHQITRYFGCFLHEFELWIVMEYLGAGSCLDLVKDLRPNTLPESCIAEILCQVVQGLAYLHMNGKIHRDIKAANVLIADQGDVKIADFGVAAQLSNNLSRRNTFVGTPFWMAPEVINELDYSFEADIWSLGITAIELAYGKPPWSHLHPMKALFTIPRSEPPRLDVRFSAEFQDFVAQCLQIDPKQRSDIAAIAKHPFLNRRSKQDLLQLIHQRGPVTSESSFLSSSNDGSQTIDSVSSKSSGIYRSNGNLSGNALNKDGCRCESFDSQRTLGFLNSSGAEREHKTSGDDDWDFDTIKPQPSLEEILQNPPPSAELPAPIPPSPQRKSPGFSTVNSLRDNTLRDNTITSKGGHNLIRIFSRAARKFKDPLLDEISDLLRSDPPTVGVETYLVKRIGKLAIANYELKQPKEKSSNDAIEQILINKWMEEVTEIRASK